MEIIGPIKQQDINEVNEYPLSIAFAPKSTIPCLLKNIIDENNGNTCTYKGRRYNLVNVQVCRVVNKGYILPGQNNIPKAELILSFSANTGEEKISGILLCVPIYDTGTPNHDTYLNQIIEQDQQNCNKEIKKSTIPTLESIFYGWDGDTTQTSIAYKTCFELMSNDTPSSKELYVVVFPNGITLTSARYQKLVSLIKINGDIPMYFIPPVIRNGEPTLSSYTTNSSGDKVLENKSSIGNIYTTSISSCDDEFKHKFVFYTRPPRSSSKAAAAWNSEQCPYYKTSEYKCVPFNQVKDLSGNLVVPGNKTLDTILNEKKEAKSNNNVSISTKAISTEQIVEIIAGVGGIAILAIIGLKVGSIISNSG
jgi:hypothetical protein